MSQKACFQQYYISVILLVHYNRKAKKKENCKLLKYQRISYIKQSEFGFYRDLTLITQIS